jgi:nucleotidyltransferase/DNA polymerase involved in DNA repair
MDTASFEEFVAHIEQSTDRPLQRLDEAIALGEALAVEADRVTDHFVSQARQSGESWTSIGDRLGVSKQAARKRFGDRVQSTFPYRFRPRLSACLDQAQREAQADGSREVGSHHLLAGLLAEGVAAAILEKLVSRPRRSAIPANVSSVHRYRPRTRFHQCRPRPSVLSTPRRTVPGPTPQIATPLRSLELNTFWRLSHLIRDREPDGSSTTWTLTSRPSSVNSIAMSP